MSGLSKILKRSKKPKKLCRVQHNAPVYKVSEMFRNYKRVSSLRSIDMLHVSDLVTKCPRSLVLEKRSGNTNLGPDLGINTIATFKVGEALAENTIDLLKIVSPDKLYGVWTCRCGVTREQGTYTSTRDHLCVKCESSLEEYGEVYLEDREHYFKGSIDLIMLIDDSYLVTEMKSISKKGFDALTGPKREHMMQAAMYWYLMYINGYKVFSYFNVKYTCKEYAGDIYKEYPIEYKDVELEVNKLLALSKRIKDSDLSIKRLPKCKKIDSPQPRICTVAAYCFNEVTE